MESGTSLLFQSNKSKKGSIFMNIIHVTDTHGTAKSPASRKDIYSFTFLKKLAELIYVAKEVYHSDMILHTGDMFHVPIVSMKFLGQVAEIIRATNIPFYVVPGNHDIIGYNTDTLDQTALGVLAKTGVIKILDRNHPLKVKCKNATGQSFEIAISGQEYHEGIDDGTDPDDFLMQQKEADLNILATHCYLVEKPIPVMSHTLLQSVNTDADIVLSGHWHQPFSKTVGDVDFYNPGAALRVDASEFNKKFLPQYGVLTVDLNPSGEIVTSYQFHKFRVARPGVEVFDFGRINQAKQNKTHLTNIQTALNTTQSMANPMLSIEDLARQTLAIVSQEFSQNGNHLDVKKIEDFYLLPAISDAKLQTISTFSNAGYEVNLQPKHIVSVELHNFQSHKDTVIPFVDGFNVITGETNQGKTAIVRLIKWITDNEPSGSNFIRTGEEDCWGKIVYSDGTYIKRSKSRKSAGSYEIHSYNDAKKQWEVKSYSGFGQNVPVDVLNVHQMPKVYLNKDIETNLNMMFQLDGPFLLSNSQTQKAEVVGKIVGTDVLDTAANSVSKSIASLKSQMKITQTNMDQLNATLGGIQNISQVQQLLKKLPQLQSHCIDTFHTMQNITSLVQQHNYNYQKLKDVIASIDIMKEALTIKEDCAVLEAFLNECNCLFAYQTLKENLSLVDEKIQAHKETLKLTSLLKEMEEKTQMIHEMEALNEVHQLTQNKQEQSAQSIQAAKQIIENVPFVNSLDAMAYEVHSMLELAEIVQTKQELLKDMDVAIEVRNENVNRLKETLEQQQLKFKEFLLLRKLCPYCHQPMTETCIKEIVLREEN